MSNDVEASSGIDRRTMLRRAAMGGAVVWATPVVQTIGMSAAAASHGTLELYGCPGNSGPKPSMLRFTYSPLACGQGQVGPALEECSSTPTGCVPSGDATITVRYGTGSFDQSQEGTQHRVKTYYNVAPNTWFEVHDDTAQHGLGNTMVVTIEADGCTQTVRFHTSCSQELNVGDRFGSLELLGGVFDS